MTASHLNNPERRTGRRPSNPELGSKVPRRSGGGRRTGLASGVVLRNCAFRVGVSHKHHRLIRVMGVRKIANGLGILIWPSTSAGVWARVVGDFVELACLGAAFTSASATRSRLATTAAAVVGATAVDLLSAQRLTRPASRQVVCG